MNVTILVLNRLGLDFYVCRSKFWGMMYRRHTLESRFNLQGPAAQLSHDNRESDTPSNMIHVFGGLTGGS
jgi:hypothetical protein